MLMTVERRTKMQALDAAFRYHLALVGNSGLSPDSFEGVQETAKEKYFDLLGAWRPWEGKGYAERKTAEFTDARQEFIDIVGVDPYDPKFKEWEAARIAEVEADDAAGAATLSDEEALLRRLQQRETPKQQEKKRA